MDSERKTLAGEVERIRDQQNGVRYARWRGHDERHRAVVRGSDMLLTLTRQGTTDQGTVGRAVTRYRRGVGHAGTALAGNQHLVKPANPCRKLRCVYERGRTASPGMLYEVSNVPNPHGDPHP